jgi:hypothetical protein
VGTDDIANPLADAALRAAASSGRLADYLLDVCDRALTALPATSPVRQTITVVRARLAEDLLRVAIGGRMKAGKSTLVNALLGESLAATDATECTFLVSWFRYGPKNLVRLRFADGTDRELMSQPLADAVRMAGRPAAEISIIEVESSNQVLRARYTIVDTPGFDSMTGRDSTGGLSGLADLNRLDQMSLDALGQADVLLYIMAQNPGENDRDMIEALRATASRAGISAVNTIGVLTQIDRIGEGRGDPWRNANRVAGRYAESLSALMSTVIPVHGLLAETALGTTFSETDMSVLRRLAAVDPADLEFALESWDNFMTDSMVPLEAPQRERLLRMLGPWGIQLSIDAIRGGVAGATKLLAVLRGKSGIDTLLTELERKFVALADGFRARVVIGTLDAVSWTPDLDAASSAAMVRMRGELDAVRGHRKLRQLDLALSMADLNAGKWRLPSDSAFESLAALTSGADVPAQLGLTAGASVTEQRDTLVALISQWRRIENTGGRATQRHARVVREYLESLYAGLG